MRLISIVSACLVALALAGSASAAAPVTSFIVQPGDLPGWSIAGRVAPQGPAAFAREHHKTLREIKATGLVVAVTGHLRGPAPSNGLSIAARYATPGHAVAEARRLHAANLEPDPGSTARSFRVPGIASSLAIRLDGKLGGKPVRGYDIVFTRGSTLVELFVIGLAGDVREREVIAAVRKLHKRALVQ